MSHEVEVWHDKRIAWMYPQIYPDKPRNRLHISLVSVRASNDLIVEFDSDRNGWVISVPTVHEWAADDAACDEKPREVAFVSANEGWPE